MTTIVCPGCGLEGGPDDGPTHAYMLSSPRCWELYGELLATGPAGQLAVDAYAVQHPGIQERRAIQSVGAHLVSLCARFEHGWQPSQATQLLQRAVELNPGWKWLDPVTPVGTITVADVVSIAHPTERTETVEAWAEDVWDAYRDERDQVREWVSRVIGL